MKPSEIKVATQHAAKRARLAEQRAAVAERKAAAAKATARQSRSIFKQARKASRKARKAAKRARAKAVQAQIALAEWKERIARSSKRLAMRKKPSEERHSTGTSRPGRPQKGNGLSTSAEPTSPSSRGGTPLRRRLPEAGPPLSGSESSRLSAWPKQRRRRMRLGAGANQ